MKIAELVILLKADVLRLSIPDAQGVRRGSWAKLLNPRFVPVLLVRLARYCYLHRWLRLLSPVLTWLNFFMFGIEVTARCDIGPGLMLPHTSGTVIGAAKIGYNATIFQGVTLGAKFADLQFDVSQRPVLGDDVMIGAGAKVLGGIMLGNGSRVGANAVVMEDVPSAATVTSIPARIYIKPQ